MLEFNSDLTPINKIQCCQLFGMNSNAINQSPMMFFFNYNKGSDLLGKSCCQNYFDESPKFSNIDTVIKKEDIG